MSARVRTAIYANFQTFHVAAEAILQSQDDLFQFRLRLGDREIAQRLPGAANARATDTVGIARDADLGDAPDHLVDPRFGHVGDDEILLTREADVAIEFGREIGDLNRLLAGDLSEEDRETHVVPTGLLLAVRTQVIRGPDWPWDVLE